MFAICVNHRNTALTQTDAYGKINSAGRLGGRMIAATEDGLMEIGAADTADGAAIEGWFEFVHDWGRMSRPIQIWIGGEFGGDMTTTVQMDGHPQKTQTASPRFVDNSQHQLRIPCRRDGWWGHYMRLRIANVNGADFGVDRIAVRPNHTATR